MLKMRDLISRRISGNMPRMLDEIDAEMKMYMNCMIMNGLRSRLNLRHGNRVAYILRSQIEADIKLINDK